jgi:hypothetical protein
LTTRLTFRCADFEAVFGWLEQRGAPVDVWGLENDRAAALLAYSDGPGDAFGWSNWAAAAYPDPSQLAAMFETLQLESDSDLGAELNAAFPGVFTQAPVGEGS